MNKKFEYHNSKFEEIPCNLCGFKDFHILAKKSSNNLKVNTCLCKNCGLIYINPRMTRYCYDEYYKYFYREDRKTAHRGKDEGGNLDGNFRNSKKYGIALARKFSKYVSCKGLTLDVGSSTGGVLAGLKEVFPKIEIIGIEPSLKESQFANDKGIETMNALFEDFNPFCGTNRRREPSLLSAQKEKLLGSGLGRGKIEWVEKSKGKLPKFSNILCVRSLNHLLDPKGFFTWCFDNLEVGGHLILEVKNFRFQCRRAGSVQAGVQIDHPFMFIPETLKLFLESAGFQVECVDDDEVKKISEIKKQRSEGLSIHHVRLVGKKPREPEKIINIEFSGSIYRKIKFQLSKPALKLHYLGFYSKRFSFLKLRNVKDWVYN